MPNKSPSYWDNTQFDIAIIGAGITGSMVAFFLEKKHPKLKVALIDAHPTPYGATTRNAGFACYGSLSEYVDDAKRHGEECALSLMLKRREGLSILKEILPPEQMDLRVDGGSELFQDSEASLFEKCLDIREALNHKISNSSHYPFKVTLKPTLESGLSEGVKVIYNQDEGSINSDLMLRQIQRRLSHIHKYFGCQVHQLSTHSSGVDIFTNHFTLTAGKVLVATNAVAKTLLSHLDVLPNRGQILVTSPIPSLNIKGNIHYQEGFYYARQLSDKRILIGGGRHIDMENEQTDRMETTSTIQTAIQQVLEAVIIPEGTHYSIDHQWAGLMGFGSNNEKSPLVGADGNVHYIVRLGGMGIALAPYLAKEWVDAI
ncbi:MAG: FAD-binding oxidoreductase [Cryomorphaceae bacterium]|nr:FAD-binding oxidoreductase [Cryomorphaceae bacterium]